MGRIAIGKVVENQKGQRLPQKDDQFTLTSQLQTREDWVLHPLTLIKPSPSRHWQANLKPKASNYKNQRTLLPLPTPPVQNKRTKR